MKKILLSAIAAIGCIAAFGQTRINDRTPEQKLNEEYCTGLFRSTEGVILDVENNSSAAAYFNILDWLESRVAGLKVYKSRYGVRFPFIRSQSASIYIDEIEVNASYLNALPPSEVAIVKVIKTPFLENIHGGGGAIAIYTFGAETEEE